MWTCTCQRDISTCHKILRYYLRRIIDKLKCVPIVRVENLRMLEKKFADSFGKVSTHPRRICATFRPFVVSKVAPFDLLIPRKLFVTREPSTSVFSRHGNFQRRRRTEKLPRKISQRLNNSFFFFFSPPPLQKFFIKFSRLSSSISLVEGSNEISSYFSWKNRNTAEGY